jgi:WD40 repeat protein
MMSRPQTSAATVQVDFYELLPRVIVTLCLSFLDMVALSRASCVSRRWWHRACGGAVDELWRREFLRLHADSTFALNLRMYRDFSWRGLCLLQGRSRAGWSEGAVERRSFLGHKDRVRHVRLRRDMIVSSSWDRSLRVVDLADETVGEFSKQVATHSGSVYGVAFDGEIAVACSEDSTIKIWNVRKEQVVAELHAHVHPVYRVSMVSKEILISCSRDFVGVWHWPSGTLMHRLRGHTHDVHRIQVSDDVIVTGSYDGTVRVWGYPSCQPLWASPACHHNGLSSLHFQGGTLATGSAKGEVFVWDLALGARWLAFDGEHHNEATVSCILVVGDRVFSTSNLSLRQNDGIVCIWDIENGGLLAKLVEPFHINALKKDFGLIYCACSDGVLRIRQGRGVGYFEVVRELVHGDKPLYDVDVQGPRAVTCGLDKAVVLWTVELDQLEVEGIAHQLLGDTYDTPLHRTTRFDSIEDSSFSQG